MSKPIHPGRIVLSASGLACYLVTLVLYSHTITPFQRYEGLSHFIGRFAPWSLVCAAVVALVFVLLSLKHVYIPNPVFGRVAGCGYVICEILFVVCALGVVNLSNAYAIFALALVLALSSVALGLVWGRVFKVLSRREALAGVACAAFIQAPLSLALSYLPAAAMGVLYGFACLVAALIPMCLPTGEPCTDESAADEQEAGERAANERAADEQGADEQGADEQGAGDTVQTSRRERVLAYLRVSAPTAIGLLAFAFVTGTMEGLVVDVYPMHLLSLVLAGFVLCLLACMHIRSTVSHIVYRVLIPALAVLLLAESSISLVLFGGSAFDMVMIYFLYTLAALLTLTTFSAMAHAAEFSCDLIFALGLGFFCSASAVGLQASSILDANAIKVSTTVITTLYAFGVVFLSNMQSSSGLVLPLSQEAFERSLDDDFSLSQASDSDSDPENVYRPIHRSAQGLGSEPSAGPYFPFAPHSALASQSLLAPRALQTLSREECCEIIADKAQLTARETEVLVFLAQGHGGGYIGEALYISPNTVRTHVHNIYRKLDVSSREEIIDLVEAQSGEGNR